MAAPLSKRERALCKHCIGGVCGRTPEACAGRRNARSFEACVPGASYNRRPATDGNRHRRPAMPPLPRALPPALLVPVDAGQSSALNPHKRGAGGHPHIAWWHRSLAHSRCPSRSSSRSRLLQCGDQPKKKETKRNETKTWRLLLWPVRLPKGLEPDGPVGDGTAAGAVLQLHDGGRWAGRAAAGPSAWDP